MKGSKSKREEEGTGRVEMGDGWMKRPREIAQEKLPWTPCKCWG